MSHLPSLFVSHGAPTFALEPGLIGEKLRRLGRALGPLRAVVVISPHWMSDEVRVTRSSQPRTLHDFRGFAPELHEIEYPAPGDPDLADGIVRRLRAGGWQAATDERRGLDHGAWVPLRHLLPDARVPVVQVSLPDTLDGAGALALGAALAPLSGEGVLVVGSGSLTHNLFEVFNGAGDMAYAQAFAGWIRAAVRDGDRRRLASALAVAPHARRAHPTPEHYWPLLVAAGAGRLDETTVLEGGTTHRVLVMDAFVFGPMPSSSESLNEAWAEY
jgi:4,5-DOPA dioxygenase extradiol